MIDGHTHHLICYYSAQDFCCKDSQRFDFELYAEMQSTLIPVDLLIDQKFRKPEAALPFPLGCSLRSRRNSVAVDRDTSEHHIRQRYNNSLVLSPATPVLSVASMIQSPTGPFRGLDFTANAILPTPPLTSTDFAYYTTGSECNLYNIDTGDRDVLLEFDHHLPSPQISSSEHDYQHSPPQTLFLNDPLQFAEHCNTALTQYEWTDTRTQ